MGMEYAVFVAVERTLSRDLLPFGYFDMRYLDVGGEQENMVPSQAN
jgi:hypothetical protein